MLVYLAAYLFMNLGAFAVVAIVRNRTGSEEVSATAGLMTRSPVLGVAFAVFLFGLLGVPPLAGFAGKFLAFSAVYDAGRTYAETDPTFGMWYYALLGVGVVNTAISAGYYLRLMRVMSLDEPTDATPLGEPTAAKWYIGMLAVAVVAFGIWWTPLIELARRATG